MIEATEAYGEMHPYADTTIAALENAKRKKLLQEDPQLKDLRRKVIAAAKLLMRAPCDMDKRRSLSIALVDLIEASDGGSDIERIEIDGRTINGTPFLNERAYLAFNMGRLGGVLIEELFPRNYRSAIRQAKKQADEPELPEFFVEDKESRPEFYFECRRP